jgi:hypothetical protein
LVRQTDAQTVGNRNISDRRQVGGKVRAAQAEFSSPSSIQPPDRDHDKALSRASGSAKPMDSD